MLKGKSLVRPIVVAVVILLLIATFAALFKTLFKVDEGAVKTHEKEIWPLMYEETVEKYSEMFRVPVYVIYATIRAESSFRADAVSPMGAVGLMQVMPATYEWLCSKGHLNEEYHLDSLSEPDTNIRVGTYYLSWLYSVFEDWELVSAAYNAGHGNVKKWMENPEYYSDGMLIYIPIEETRNYVKKVLSYEDSYKSMYAERAWNDYNEPLTNETTDIQEKADLTTKGSNIE